MTSKFVLKVIYIYVWVLYLTGIVFPQGTVSVLGREEGYTVEYTPLPEGVPEGVARGNC